MIKKVGFIGLGLMGEPMAANLLAAGFELTVHDLRREACEPLVSQGATAARETADLRTCEVVVIMVNTGDQTVSVVGELLDGGGVHPGSIVCMSTILPFTSRELGGEAARAGVAYLEAPVSGGPIVARSGGLAIMAGGEEGLFERSRPLLEAMGSSIGLIGGLGAGLSLKLVNNMVAIPTFTLVLEALCVGLEQGLELETMVEVIKASSGNTWVTENWEQVRMFLALAMADPGQLRSLLATGRKDMELAAEMCRIEGVQAPLLERAIESLDSQAAEDLQKRIAAVIAAAG